MELPSELTEEASLRGNEYAWTPSAFPHVLASAEAFGFACLGGQFQFRTPDATCEMYWLNADATDRLVDEPWSTFVARSCEEVSSAFSALLQSTDFLAEAQCWPDVPELSGAGASPEQYLCFVAYFIPERPAPKRASGDHVSGRPRALYEGVRNGGALMEISGDSVTIDKTADTDHQVSPYEAFAQDEYYTKAWQPLLSATNGGVRFNWAAALLGMTWCFYRKMYATGLLLVVGAGVIMIVFGVVVKILIPEMDIEGQAFTSTAILVWWFAIRVPFGFLANRIYFRKATRVIKKARIKDLSPDELSGHLRDRGGISVIGLGVAIAIGAAVRLLIL